MVNPVVFRKVSMLAVSLLIVLVSAVPAGAEGPTDYACDPSTRIVCAGAGTGADVRCDAVDSPVVDCDYTLGWIAMAFSPLFLPGEGQAEGTFAVEACSSVSGCTVIDSGSWSDACDWAGVSNACTMSGGDAGSYRGVPIAMGECVTITVSVHTAAWGQAPRKEGLPMLGDAHHEGSGEGAGQVCQLDDGR